MSPPAPVPSSSAPVAAEAIAWAEAVQRALEARRRGRAA